MHENQRWMKKSWESGVVREYNVQQTNFHFDWDMLQGVSENFCYRIRVLLTFQQNGNKFLEMK